MINYNWVPANGTDIPEIVNMAEQHFQIEIDEIFKPSPVIYSRNITLAVVNQFYSPLSELLSVAKDSTGKILAYTWASTNEKTVWSDDQMLVIKIAHVNLQLSARDRVRLIKDMMQLWESYAKLINIPIICSTTMRNDQAGFLKLHAQKGYSVRGSYAYKKLSALQTGLPIP